MSENHKRRADPQAPEGLGPVDLAKAVLSWIIVAIATLVVVWVLVFAITRGDLVGLLIAIVVGGLLVGVAVFRRRSG